MPARSRSQKSESLPASAQAAAVREILGEGLLTLDEIGDKYPQLGEGVELTRATATNNTDDADPPARRVGRGSGSGPMSPRTPIREL